MSLDWFIYFEQLLNQEVHINDEFADYVNDYTNNHDADCETSQGHVNEDASVNQPITEKDIIDCIKSMSNGKSCGIDGVVIEMLKSSLHITVPYLKHLYNAILTQQWCKAVLVPIHKKGSLTDPNNYRGIALLSVLGKVFTKVINNRLVQWAETENLQREEQAGFRRGYSTTDNIFVLQALIQKYISRKGGRFYVLFVEFSKAFDTIPHPQLFYQLLTKGLHGNVLKIRLESRVSVLLKA